MSGGMTDRPSNPLTLLGRDRRSGRPGALVIAAGTPFEIVVRDARSLYRWAERQPGSAVGPPHHIIYHHTASRAPKVRGQQNEMYQLALLASGSTWGLPYNFIVSPTPPYRIYYLNDVDLRWPHTFGFNGSTAIAAWGNYSVEEPPAEMVGRMTALADALATMWGEWVWETQHRDHQATECPGNRLSPQLPSETRQRGL